MDTIEQARQLLQESERRLRQLVGDAAVAGEYDGAQLIADWARTLGALVLETGRRSAGDSARPQAAEGREITARRARRAARSGAYPKFYRRDDQLVKIGWSKKEAAEYEHKAPRRVLQILAEAIARRSASGKLVTAEDLFPLKDPQDAREIPGYQAYVALAWLKSTGALKQHGRRGYSARSASQLGDAILASWQKLPERGA